MHLCFMKLFLFIIPVLDAFPFYGLSPFLDL
jgi:hypothetical protein